MNFRRAAAPAFLLALLLLLSACASPAAQTDAGEAAISFADDNGRSVSLAAAPARVLAPQSSFADMWVLAGGEVCATSQETFDEGVVRLAEDTVNVGSLKTPDLETILGAGVDFAILSSNIAEHADIGQRAGGRGRALRLL